MEPSEFYTMVRQQADLESNGEAETAVEAVLETLSERLAPGETEEIAGELPNELAGMLETEDASEEFGPDEFLARVENRAGADEEFATLATRATTHALEEAVGEAFVGVREQFPAEYEGLFASAADTQ